MVDVLTAAQRSYNMSRIRGTGTVPEKKFAAALKGAGIVGFKMHPKHIPGRPDIYFAKEKLAVFVDGCFWHGCSFCFKAPATNQEFWRKKITSNLIRDKKVDMLLGIKGIRVIRIREHEIKSDVEKSAALVRQQLKRQSAPTVLDLFAGAGGLSEGFAQMNCEMIGHIEMDKDACETIKTRVIFHALRRRGKLDDYYRYLKGEITRETLVTNYELQNEVDTVVHAEIGSDTSKRIIRSIKKKLGAQKLDLIVGGPPCQAYSNIGRARMRDKVVTDKRNFLYRHYVSFLKELKPKMFVFENVPGLLSAGGGKYLKDMREAMEKAGYKTDYKIINAPELGIPQSRRRIILMGWRKSLKITYPAFEPVQRTYKVENFFSDLPAIKDGESRKIQKYREHSLLLETLGIRDPDMDFLPDHVTRPHSEADKKIYKLAAKAKKEGRNIKYIELPKELRTHKNQTSFMDRFKVVDFAADAAQTVVAHISKDGHYYIHPDAQQNRSLSVREAARLQTFPDNYKFEGSRTSQYKQIGNAVPPMLSKVIAQEILKYL